jgi:hypothetical protein
MGRSPTLFLARLRHRLFGGDLFASQVIEAATAFFNFAVLLSHDFFSAELLISNKLAANMKIRPAPFNIILIAASMVLGLGCESNKSKLKKEDVSTIRFHAESDNGVPGRTMTVQISETPFIEMVLITDPFLTEANVLKAEAWDTTDGGVAIRLELDRRGRRMVEINSGLLRGRRIAVMSQFPESRWIAVTMMEELGRDGVVLLYPATTPEETDRLVKGLNLLARELDKDRDEEDRPSLAE